MKPDSSVHRIRRRFLVPEIPPELRLGPPIRLEFGYILQDETREVRLRSAGRDWFLAVRENGVSARDRVEIPLSRAQFQSLWPLTEGHRLLIRRQALTLGGRRAHLDAFEADHSPLVLADVHFDHDTEAAASWEKPEFLGLEVTGVLEYRHGFLAAHGLPNTALHPFQIGALPYLFRRGRLHVVLVTNSTQTRWILPKGQPERRMTRADVALMEAFEEAGVLGEITPGIRGRCERPKARPLYILPLRVSKLLRVWPETASRKRLVLPYDKALAKVDDPGLAECIERMVGRLRE